MNWTMVSMLQTIVTRADGKGLSVMLFRTGPGRRGWELIAAEAQTPHGAKDGHEAIKLTLDDHAHQVLEPQDTLLQAMAVAEEYARWWQRSGAVADACACVEIGTPPRALPARSPSARLWNAFGTLPHWNTHRMPADVVAFR